MSKFKNKNNFNKLLLIISLKHRSNPLTIRFLAQHLSSEPPMLQQPSSLNIPKFLLTLWTLGIILILISYFFLDRDISSFLYSHHVRESLADFKMLVEWPPILEALSPFVLLLTLLIKIIIPKQNKIFIQIFDTLLIIFISVMLTYLLKNDFKWIFSRYWPETFTHQNLSWISNHVYGFQWFQGAPFQGSDLTGSFPSGHTSIAFAFFISLGLCCRKFLKYGIILASLEGLSMVLFDYHFMSDVIAGACLGTTCGVLVWDV